MQNKIREIVSNVRRFIDGATEQEANSVYFIESYNSYYVFRYLMYTIKELCEAQF